MIAGVMEAGEIANTRKDNQRSLLYLGIYTPPEIATCRLQTVPTDDDQVTNIDVKTWAWKGTFSDAWTDMLVYIGTSAGAYDKGMVRLREDLSGTPSDFDIGETSEIDWAVDDYITIVDEYNLHPKHLYINPSTQVVYMDYDIAYSDQHSDFDPVPIMGPYLNPAWLVSGTVDVDFDASDSYEMGGGGVTYLWTSEPSANLSWDNNTSATPTATITAAGTYRIGCTVNTGTKTFTGVRYVIVYNKGVSNPVTSFVLESCSGDWSTGGWSARVVLHDEATRTEIRDRAAVVLFADEWYGTSNVSIGPISDREDSIFVGWVDGESIEWDPEEGTVAFDIQGPHFWLQKMQGFPSGLESCAGAPAVWTDMQTLTTRKGLWHFAHWRTTITRMMDLRLTADTREIALFNASPGTLWTQIYSEAEATIFAYPCADRYGRLWVDLEQQIIPTGDRGSIPLAHTLETQDLVRPITITRKTVPETAMVDLSGIFYVVATPAATPFFSLAPGHIPKWLGGGIERYERLALASQGQSNTLSGLVLGWKNNEYPEVSLPLASNNRCFDIVPHMNIDLTIAAGDTERGISGTLSLIPRSVSITHNPETGVLLVDVQAEGETDETGAPHMDGDVPSVPPDGGTPDPPPPPWDPVPETDPGWPDVGFYCPAGEGSGSGGVYACTDFIGTDGSGQPTWTATAADGTWPVDGLIRCFGADPSDPTDNLYVLCETARDIHWYNGTTWANILDTVTDIQTAGALYLSADAQLEWMKVDRTTGTIWAMAIDQGHASVDAVGVYESDDYGATWTKHIVHSTDGTHTILDVGNLDVYGGYVVVAFIQSAANWMGYVYNGSSWSAISDPGGASLDEQRCRLAVATYSAKQYKRIYEDVANHGILYGITHADVATKLNASEVWPHCAANIDYDARFWASDPDSGIHQRTLQEDGNLLVTPDEWSTRTSAGVVLMDAKANSFCEAICQFVAEDFDTDRIVYMTNQTGLVVETDSPHVLGVAYGETDLVADGKAGDNPQAGFADSIPYDCRPCLGEPLILFYSGDIA